MKRERRERSGNTNGNRSTRSTYLLFPLYPPILSSLMREASRARVVRLHGYAEAAFLFGAYRGRNYTPTAPEQPSRGAR